MSYKYTDYVYLRKNRPDLMRERFLDALIETSGQVTKAWVKLGLSSFSWYRYIKELGMEETIRSTRLAYRHPTGKYHHYSEEAS